MLRATLIVLVVGFIVLFGALLLSGGFMPAVGSAASAFRPRKTHPQI